MIMVKVMNKKDFFPPRPSLNPTIYGFEFIDVPSHKGMIKIGFTDRDGKTRVAEQLKITALKYKIVFEESAMKSDGSSFTDHDVHRYLRKKGFENPENEWFKCTVKDIKAAVVAIKTGEKNEENRTLNFKMRPEQQEAVHKTITKIVRF